MDKSDIHAASENVKLILTGGHAGSTAYALIQEIKIQAPDWSLVFVGSKSATEGSQIQTLENTYFPKLGIKYIPLTSGRLQRKFTIWTIPSLFKIPIGILQSLKILLSEKPDIVVSFGGYTAFPMVMVSRLLGIPVVIHEQTSAAGRANIVSSYFADGIAISREESMSYFPKNNCVLTGNPISKEVTNCIKKKVNDRHNAVFITGGSRGSLTLNNAVRPIIKPLLKKYKVFHQTGERDYEKFVNFKKSLGKKLGENYIVFATVEMWNWYKYLRDSDILVSRSGANIVSESVALRMPSIFVPLKFAYKDEQLKNAQYSFNLGLAEIIMEDDLTPYLLLAKIDKVSKSWNKIVRDSRFPPIDDSKASSALFDLIEKTLIDHI